VNLIKSSQILKKNHIRSGFTGVKDYQSMLHQAPKCISRVLEHAGRALFLYPVPGKHGKSYSELEAITDFNKAIVLLALTIAKKAWF
jgi:hypothetical protein